MTREQLRRRYRPAQVRLLFIGESPPASGRFFYQADSGLYRAMLQAFRAVGPSLNAETFLDMFQASGCYLVDLCPQPVDRLAPSVRRAAHRENEAPLARAIARLQPQMMITMLRSIEPSVSRAVARAAWSGPLLHLPYPGRWAHLRDEFLQGVVPVITRLLETLETGTGRPNLDTSP